MAVAIPGFHDLPRAAQNAVAPPLLGLAASIGALTVLKITVAAIAVVALALVAYDRMEQEPVSSEPVPLGAVETDAVDAVNMKDEHFAAPLEDSGLLASRKSLEVADPSTAAEVDVPTLSGRLILHDVDGTVLPGPYDGKLQLSVFCLSLIHI